MGNGLLRNTTKVGVVRLDWLGIDAVLDKKNLPYLLQFTNWFEIDLSHAPPQT